MVEVVWTDEAVEQLGRLPTTIKARLQVIRVRLLRWPAVSGAKPLRGRLAGRYRLRTGDYRMQIWVRETRVEDENDEPTRNFKIYIEKVGHRDGFYES